LPRICDRHILNQRSFWKGEQCKSEGDLCQRRVFWTVVGVQKAAPFPVRIRCEFLSGTQVIVLVVIDRQPVTATPAASSAMTPDGSSRKKMPYLVFTNPS
jgi:hypothetical protein